MNLHLLITPNQVNLLDLISHIIFSCYRFLKSLLLILKKFQSFNNSHPSQSPGFNTSHRLLFLLSSWKSLLQESPSFNTSQSSHTVRLFLLQKSQLLITPIQVNLMDLIRPIVFSSYNFLTHIILIPHKPPIWNVPHEKQSSIHNKP